MIRCPNCGELNDSGSRFCFNCGAQLESVAPTPEPQPQPVPTTPPPLYQPQPTPEPERAAPEAERPVIPPQYAPPSYAGTPSYGQREGWSQRPPQPSGWAALDELDPPPPPRKRATWLMILLGIIAGCLLLCVGVFIFALTPVGQDTFEELGTVVAEFATEAAPEPTRAP